MLTCSCNEWEGDGPCWFAPEDFTTLRTVRRRRCGSCGVLIDRGSECVEFTRMRMPRNDIEDRIWGYDAEIPLASHWMCEKCGEAYFNLEAIGYCVEVDSSMSSLMAEYHRMTGFRPIGGGGQ